MRKARWTVIESTPGYLPESDPALFTNKRDAERYAAELARELRELGYAVTGSARFGVYWAEHEDLPRRMIEVLPVEDEVYIDEYGEVVA